ncbi:MAG TPA: hypothetical protein VK624_02605 [Steroidobacteraceae bacterium]|nr:hypothetical protein [Steroidobacteraceae bacterium]
MFRNLTNGLRKSGIAGTAAALFLLGATLAVAGDATPEEPLAGWLGREYTVESSTLNDHMPTGGKLTFIFDSDDNVVRVCTRTVQAQRGPWRMDFAVPCGVTLTFTRGTRYCTLEDVKAGNAEVLSSCHRLRTRDIAMRPAKVKGAIELNDMIAFLVQGENGKHVMSILVDSPARVTENGQIIVKE